MLGGRSSKSMTPCAFGRPNGRAREGRGELRQAHPDAGVCGVLDGFLKLVELRARTKQKTKSFRAAFLLPGA